MAAGEILYLFRQKTVLDTSVYISHLVRGRHPDLVGKIRNRYILYLSSVVFTELAGGCRTKKEKQALEKIKKEFTGTKRMITPSDHDWEETGWLLSKIAKEEKGARIALTHDILIALSARAIGATVITENRRDFEKIRSHKDFSLEVWPSF